MSESLQPGRVRRLNANTLVAIPKRMAPELLGMIDLRKIQRRTITGQQKGTPTRKMGRQGPSSVFPAGAALHRSCRRRRRATTRDACHDTRPIYNRRAGMKNVLRLFAATIMFASGAASASCECVCVSGEVKAMCQSSIDVQPVCAPRVCPITPPSVEPISPPRVPPIGTSRCAQKQIYNDRTGKYEWKEVCS
jgi:hypothetical protein